MIVIKEGCNRGICTERYRCPCCFSV